MPEFFFHISLELAFDPSRQQKDLESSWQTGVKALSPFIRHQTKKGGHKPSRPISSGSWGLSTRLSENSLGPTSPSKQRRFSEEKTTTTLDQRFDSIHIESAGSKMAADAMAGNQISKGIGMSANGQQTKGRYESLDQEADSLWGIIHLYRDSDETPGLYGDALLSKPTNPWYSRTSRDTGSTPHPPAVDQDCTTLCVLAVPSYLAPSDFLGFVGDETREEVSHFRMIRTARANRYMVLMKFREGRFARKWQKAWNGRVFNSMEPETCHVVFIKSVEITTSESQAPDTFPDTRHDPFTSPTASKKLGSTKPPAPRTPSLIELPTCPVCLERMDETTGLLTILCQHVFHCTCLQKWSGGGCPVCRYTHDDFSSRPNPYKSSKKDPYSDSSDSLECTTCQTDANLWQCLICGNIGCGRYEAKHAFTHYEKTSHSFAMDLSSKRVWDYSGDGYVHRIMQNSGGDGGDDDPSKASNHPTSTTTFHPSDYEDSHSGSAKIEDLALEYTHLLTSQLESQRVYYEEQVQRAADKATSAATSAAAISATTSQLSSDLDALRVQYTDLARDAVPALEREKTRLEKRAGKFEEMAKGLEKDYQEEKTINKRLMERIEHLGRQLEGLRAEKGELEEQNRDLSFFISGGERLREAGEEVVEGTVVVGEAEKEKESTGKKRKGKGKKKN